MIRGSSRDLGGADGDGPLGAAGAAGPGVGGGGAGHPVGAVVVAVGALGAWLVVGGGLLGGHVVLRAGGAVLLAPLGGRRGLPAAASSAAHGRGGSRSRAGERRILGERSGPEGGQEASRALDRECGRAKLGARSTAPPQAGPHRRLACAALSAVVRCRCVAPHWCVWAGRGLPTPLTGLRHLLARSPTSTGWPIRC